MTKTIPAVLALILAACALPAHAATACYGPEEAAAERLLRLHSEIMVITVTCKQGSTGRDLVKAYTGFTRRNANKIQAAEKVLINHFSKSYGGDGTERLDQLRTKLANAYGQEIADESAPSFCRDRRDYVTALYDATAPGVLEATLAEYDGDPVSAPSCGAKGPKIKVASADVNKAKKTPPQPPAQKAPAVDKTKKVEGR